VSRATSMDILRSLWVMSLPCPRRLDDDLFPAGSPESPASVESTGPLLTPPPRRRYLLLGASPGLVWYTRACARVKQTRRSENQARRPGDRRNRLGRSENAVRPAALPETVRRVRLFGHDCLERGFWLSQAQVCGPSDAAFYATGERPRVARPGRANPSRSGRRLLPGRGQKSLWRGQSAGPGTKNRTLRPAIRNPADGHLGALSALASGCGDLGGRK
jgi:hypothetical protein